MVGGWCLKMHALVREMGVGIGREHYHFMARSGEDRGDIVLHELEWTEDLTKVAMICNGIRSMSSVLPLKCPNLSTLLLLRNPIIHMSDDFFSQMNGLKVLNLSYTPIQKLRTRL